MISASKYLRWVAYLLLLGLGSPMMAQANGSQNNPPAAGPGGAAGTHLQIAVTGCLKRGHENGGYYITDQDGRTWELIANGVDLAEHLNHSVTVSGKPMNASTQREANKEQSEKAEGGGNPHFDLKVMSVKMLSPSCTR